MFLITQLEAIKRRTISETLKQKSSFLNCISSVRSSWTTFIESLVTQVHTRRLKFVKKLGISPQGPVSSQSGANIYQREFASSSHILTVTVVLPCSAMRSGHCRLPGQRIRCVYMKQGFMRKHPRARVLSARIEELHKQCSYSFLFSTLQTKPNDKCS